MIVARLYATIEHLGLFLPYSGNVWYVQLTFPVTIPDYFDEWDLSPDYNTTPKVVGSLSLVYNSITVHYAKKSDLNSCIGDVRSFYFDVDDQILYVHFEDIINPQAISNIRVGEQQGFTNEKTMYFGDVEYPPYILNIPSISKDVDPLEHGNIAFVTQKLELLNTSGEVDTLLQSNPSGMLVEIGLYDEELDAEINLHSGYIHNIAIGRDKVTITIKDKRAYDNIKIPRNYFTATEYANIEDKYLDKVKPEGYGTIKNMPCICLDGKAFGTHRFKYATDATTLISIEVKVGDAWVDRTSQATLYTSVGEFTLAQGYCQDANGGMFEVRATALLRNITKAPDIIVDMNDRYLSYVFDEANYNLDEWMLESALLDFDVALYMDEAKEFFMYVGELQKSNRWGFIYDITSDGRRTLRVNYPNREERFKIDFWQILNANMPGELDFERYASKVLLKYDKDYYEDSYLQVINTTYEVETIQKYGYAKDYELETCIKENADAVVKAENVIEDFKIVRPTFDIQIFVDDKRMLEYKLFDTGIIDFEQPAVEHHIPLSDRFALNPFGSDILFVEPDNLDTFSISLFLRKLLQYGREYFGELRCQIIGRSYKADTNILTLTCRARPRI